MRPAGFWIRVLAMIIDIILFSIFKGALSFLFMALGIVREATPQEQALLQEMAQSGATAAEVFGASIRIMVESGAVVGSGIHIVLSYLIIILFITLKGGTPGKLALGLRIQEKGTSKNPPFWRAFLREIVGKAFLWPLTLGIGAYMVAFQKEKRGLHDIVGGTMVVKLNDE